MMTHYETRPRAWGSKILQVVQVMVLITATVFLAATLWSGLSPDNIARLHDRQLILVLSLFAAIYGGVLLLSALGWYVLVRARPGKVPVRLRDAMIIYGSTFVAKYLPVGSVFYLLGRQVVGASYGLSQSTIAIGTLYEILLLVSAGGAVTTLIVALSTLGGAVGKPWAEIEVYGLAAASAALLPWIAIGLARLRKTPLLGRWAALAGDALYLPLPAIFLAWLLYAGFVVGASVLLWTVSRLFSANVDFTTVLAASGLVYVMSYITPSGPGGLGVREAFTVITLEPSMGSGAAVLAALCLRVLMICGDIIFWLAIMLLQRFSR